MAVTMRDVARIASVSHGTVSNVLNDIPSVRPEIRERVFAAIESSGYVRNETARQLKGGRSRILGLIVLDTANPFYSELANGAQEATAGADAAVMMCNSDNDVDKEEAYLTLFEEHRAQGIILAAGQVTAHLREKLTAVSKRGTAMVLIGGIDDIGTPICTVCGDDALGASMAANHLLDLKHTRIAMVNGPQSLNVCRLRQTGFLDGLNSRGTDVEFTLIERDHLTIDEGYEAARSLLSESNPPTAVFCANDLLALGVLQFAVEHNIAVPEQLAIVGYDDIAFAAGAAIPLTSVHQSGRDIGRAAAELLREESGEPVGHVHQNIVFPPRLVPRTSTTNIRAR